MSRERLIQTFGRDRVFLPVIHPVSKDIAMKSIGTAVDAGADGIFLIDQGMTVTELLDFVPAVAKAFPNLWIGLNILEYDSPRALRVVRAIPQVRGLWSDNAGIDEVTGDHQEAYKFQNTCRGLGWPGLYFGGVAFKYQRPVQFSNLQKAARESTPLMDVITTSGAGTGLSADLDKVRQIHMGAKRHPIALASGVTPENVQDYLPYVNAYLVASGIETSKYSGVLIPERTRELAEAIHSYKGPPAVVGSEEL
jgi:predicted TIM-barrel enzyme